MPPRFEKFGSDSILCRYNLYLYDEMPRIVSVSLSSVTRNMLPTADYVNISTVTRMFPPILAMHCYVDFYEDIIFSL